MTGGIAVTDAEYPRGTRERERHEVMRSHNPPIGGIECKNRDRERTLPIRWNDLRGGGRMDFQAERNRLAGRFSLPLRNASLPMLRGEKRLMQKEPVLCKAAQIELTKLRADVRPAARRRLAAVI